MVTTGYRPIPEGFCAGMKNKLFSRNTGSYIVRGTMPGTINNVATVANVNDQ